jgi:hypothetical protein
MQGYDADHKDIKLLRLKNFTISRKLVDSEITSADSLERIADLIGSMVPFVSIYIVLSFWVTFKQAFVACLLTCLTTNRSRI